MILVTVEASFTPETIAAAIDSFRDQAKVVRKLPGCRHYTLYQDEMAVVIVQKWDETAQFDAYRDSQIFRDLGAALKPIMAAPPVTTVARVAKL